MAVELYTGFPAVIDGTNIGHAGNAEGDLGLKRMDIRGMGKLEAINFGEASREPTTSMQTAALKVLLDTLGVSLTSGLVSTGNNILQFQQSTDDGAFQSGSNHFTVKSTKAFHQISSISVAQDDEAPAVATVESHHMKGSAEPFIPASGQALTGAVALTDWYTLGPIYQNGTEIGGEMSVEIVSGIQFGPVRSGGQKRAEKGRIVRRQAELRLGVKNMSVLSTHGFGINNATGDIDIYLRHNDDSGRTADASAAHILITFSTAKWDMRKVAARDTGEIVMTPTLLNTGTVSTSVASIIPHA